MTKHIANIITLMNAFFGCLAIVCLFKEQYYWVFAAFALGLVADFADGFVARALKTKSAVGKELDSMADMVTFGVFPGMVLYFLISQSNQDFPEWIAYIGFLFPCFSAYRLAKFNLDTRQSENFLGLAVPASSCFILGLLLIYTINPTFQLLHPIAMIFFLLILGSLMISELPMFSLKFKGFQWKGNGIRFLFLIFVLLMILGLKAYSLSGIIVGYVLFSFGGSFIEKNAS